MTSLPRSDVVRIVPIVDHTVRTSGLLATIARCVPAAKSSPVPLSLPGSVVFVLVATVLGAHIALFGSFKLPPGVSPYTRPDSIYATISVS